MSFGFTIGDAIAVVNLLERAVVEIRNYRNAPRHFQQLATELHLLQSTLQRLLQIKPYDDEEHAHLEHIRAIAIHCSQPLQAFMAKMRSSEKSLGHVRSAGTLSTFGTRLHWSLITRQDVEEVRKVVLTEMTAINMLLGMQQLASLRKLTLRDTTISYAQLNELCKTTGKYYSDSAAAFKEVRQVSERIIDLRGLISRSDAQQIKHNLEVNKCLNKLSETSQVVVHANQAGLTMTQKLRDQIARSFETTMAITADIKKILILLQALSKDVLAKVASNTRLLLDMHMMMKRLLRAVEAIPLHLSLAIVRLDDGLGESWALPFQACRTISSFEEILKTVVFGNDRPGVRYVEHRRYILRSAQNSKILDSSNWDDVIKEGAHVTQAMIVTGTDQRGYCSFSNCSGRLNQKNSTCDKCGRSSTIELALADQFNFAQSPEPFIEASRDSHTSSTSHSKRVIGRRRRFGSMEIIDDIDVDLFRNVHVQVQRPAITSLSEAKSLLLQEPKDAKALQYLGWWHLCHAQSYGTAAQFLEKSIDSDSGNQEAWYLLGRTYMNTRQYVKVHEAYQQVVCLYSRCAAFWLSVAVWYFQLTELKECRDALATAIRLNPYLPDLWYNLGILYENSRSRSNTRDAIYAYQRATDLNPGDLEAKARHAGLSTYLITEDTLPRPPSEMRDLDLLEEIHTVAIADAMVEIDIPSLDLSDYELPLESEYDTQGTDLSDYGGSDSSAPQDSARSN